MNHFPVRPSAVKAGKIVASLKENDLDQYLRRRFNDVDLMLTCLCHINSVNTESKEARKYYHDHSPMETSVR